MPQPTRRSTPLFSALLCLGVAAAAGACGDLTRPTATRPAIADSVTAYALTGAQVGAPNALYIYGASVVQASGTFGFDFAFDFDSIGRVVLRPVRTLAGALTLVGHSVGFQNIDAKYDNV